MKKILSLLILGIMGITYGINNVIACYKKNNKNYNNIDNNKLLIIPNSFEIKNELLKKGYNVDNLDIEMNLGMKSAIIRFMPDIDKKPFLIKKINFDWKTNDIKKIITKTSLPYVENFKKNNNIDKNSVLDAINILNGTKFTLNDLDIKLENNNNYILIPNKNGKFAGEQVQVINEPFMSFLDIFPNKNLGYIYFDESAYKSNFNFLNTNGGSVSKFAQFMEFLGDRNKLGKYYKNILQKEFSNIITGIKITQLEFPEFNKQKTINLNLQIPEIVNESKLEGTFIAKSSDKWRIFLNFENKKPKNNEEINIFLNKKYTKNTIDILKYDIVKNILGEKISNKYKDILYDEICLLYFNENKKEAILMPKPGSKIFAVSDKLAEKFTWIPFYTIKVFFN